MRPRCARYRRQFGHRRRQGFRKRGTDRTGADQHRGIGRAGADNLPKYPVTWIINKISRTILKAVFVAIAFVVTGKFVVSAFAMLLLVFVLDFATIAMATDHVRTSNKPETWNIGGFNLETSVDRLLECIVQ
ncbi:MAG: hypothetical protein ACYCTW_09305 [Sulfuricella sp.]